MAIKSELHQIYKKMKKESLELENQQEEDYIYKGCIDTKAETSKQPTAQLVKMIWKLLRGGKWVQVEICEIETKLQQF